MAETLTVEFRARHARLKHLIPIALHSEIDKARLKPLVDGRKHRWMSRSGLTMTRFIGDTLRRPSYRSTTQHCARPEQAMSIERPGARQERKKGMICVHAFMA